MTVRIGRAIHDLHMDHGPAELPAQTTHSLIGRNPIRS